MKTEKPLTQRQLNRALLARQLLLGREKTTPLKAIERLVGIQSQLARPPFLGLWSRVAGFERTQLAKLAEQKAVVRVTAMRGTLHLMSARDFLALRSTIQPVLDRGLRSVLKDRLDALDLPRILGEATQFLAKTPAPFETLREHLKRLHPKFDERAMGYSVRMTVPLVMVPTADAWSWPGSADFTPAEAWLGTPVATQSDPRELVLRYLGAFGPATPADAQNWSGLQKLGDTFEALRPKLKTFRDEQGRELFDLPKAPRPDEDVPAPARFLPEFDTLVMGHADRTRVIDDEFRARISTKNLQVTTVFLLDGRVAGSWKIERSKKAATLALTPFQKLGKAAKDALTAEGTALLRFAEPDAQQFAVR